MPEEVILRCDAPDCDEVGVVERFTCKGKEFEVILGPKHHEILQQLASWGRPARSKTPRERRGRRGTDPARLLSLVDADDGKVPKTPTE